jgi:hypothetical protein
MTDGTPAGRGAQEEDRRETETCGSLITVKLQPSLHDALIRLGQARGKSFSAVVRDLAWAEVRGAEASGELPAP